MGQSCSPLLGVSMGRDWLHKLGGNQTYRESVQYRNYMQFLITQCAVNNEVIP